MGRRVSQAAILAMAFLGAGLVFAATSALTAEDELSPQQMQKLLQRIPEADANKDGKLTREEVQTYLRNRKSGKSARRSAERKPNAPQTAATADVTVLAMRLSAEARPGRNVLKWDDVLARDPPANTATANGDSIAWAYSEARGYYRIFRSCHLEDGYHIVNLEGEVQESRYVDEQVVPGVRYYYKVVACRNKAELGVSTPVEVVAQEGRRDPVEEGVWKTSAGRFSLDEDLPPVVDEITTHGGIGGYAYGITNRQLFLLYPSLPNKTSWPKSFRLEGSKQHEHLQDCLVLGSVGLDGSGGGKPSYRVEHSGWDSLVYKAVYAGGQSLGVIMNGMMPALTVYTDEPALVLFGNRGAVGTPLPAWVAFSQNGQIVARPLVGRVSLEGMDRSWLLFWWGDGAVSGQENVDTPCLVVLSARAEAIAAAGGGLKLTFPHGARHMSLMPLYGVTKKSTMGWEKALPAEAVESAARWERRLKSIPVRCRDRFELREAENRVRVTLSYDYLEAPDDWGTEPVALAPVAPSTSYAKLSGYPIQYQSAVIPQDFACYCGPFEAAENAREVVYDLPAQMDAIVKGYTPQITRPELLPEIKKILNADAQVASASSRPPSHSKRRPRTLPLALAPYLAAYPILSDQSRKSVEQICGDYLAANRYFDLTTYGFRRDRYSGKKYIVSSDPEQRSATGVTDYSLGTGPALWTLYQYAKVLNKWDLIRTHWDSVTQYGTVFEAGTDWNRQAPCGTTFLHDWSSSPDFLMAHMQGHLALARMAREVGDEVTYRRSVYQFSRTLLTYVVSWNIQKWAFEHRPHFTPPGSAPPEQGYTYASAVRGDSVIQNFLNSSSPVNPAAFWPFTRSCPDLAVFWDLYLRDTLAKYLYHDLAILTPHCIDLHSLLARAYLFDNDPQKIRHWIDHGAMHVGDWGSGNHFAVFMSVLCQPPVRIKPPDPQWINQDYEARIAGADRACDLRSFEKVSASEEKMKALRPMWTIGRRDNSGREFSLEELSPASMLQQIAKLRPEAQGLQRRGILLKEPDLLRHIVEKTDGEVYTIGKSTAADWRYVQPSAWSVMGGALSYEGRHHPRAISFAMRGPLGTEDYCFALALCRLDPHFPLFMTIELNGHATAVRCPLPFSAAREADDEAQGSSAEARTILAFRVPAAWLKIGENRLTVHVEGTSRVFYDWLGFGKFLRSDTPLE